MQLPMLPMGAQLLVILYAQLAFKYSNPSGITSNRGFNEGAGVGVRVAVVLGFGDDWVGDGAADGCPFCCTNPTITSTNSRAIAPNARAPAKFDCAGGEYFA